MAALSVTRDCGVFECHQSDALDLATALDIIIWTLRQVCTWRPEGRR